MVDVGCWMLGGVWGGCDMVTGRAGRGAGGAPMGLDDLGGFLRLGGGDWLECGGSASSVLRRFGDGPPSSASSASWRWYRM